MSSRVPSTAWWRACSPASRSASTGSAVAGPDLAVRVRVAGTHRGAAVLEDLDPAVALAELGGLVSPDVDDATDRRLVHAREGHVVAGREAHDPAGAPRTLGTEQPGGHAVWRRVRAQRREVVGEDEGVRVVRVQVAGHARVPWAEVAARVVDGALLRRIRLFRAQPRTLRAARGDKHPLAGQGVETAMRLGVEGGDGVVGGPSGCGIRHGRSLLLRRHGGRPPRRRPRRRVGRGPSGPGSRA